MQDKINEQEIELQRLKGMRSIRDVSWRTLTRLSIADLEKAHAAKRVLEQRAAMARAGGTALEDIIVKPKGSPGDPGFSLIHVMELQDDKLSYLAIQVCNGVC